MIVFVSSTYDDLAAHRKAVLGVLTRMKLQHSAMEYFGSRADEKIPACKKEIDLCELFVGIYAWRYGSQATARATSITEEEFLYARDCGKRCFCYVVDDNHPWPPGSIDQGEPAEKLRRFKRTVGKLVRSRFTSPDNLAMQVAADLARELTPAPPPESFGGLVRLNWEVFSPEVQGVLSTAYSQARETAENGVVATRHVVSALAAIPNSSRALFSSFRDVPIQPLASDLPMPSLEELFGYDRPISSCVLASMNRLLPQHTRSQRLLAIELAVDLLKYGRGSSVADFRSAGVDATAVDKTASHIRAVAANTSLLRTALGELEDAEVVHVAYLADIHLQRSRQDSPIREQVLNESMKYGRRLRLVGELMRRYPRLVVLE